MVEQNLRIIDYSHHSSVTQFQQATANIIQEDLLNGVKASDGFSLLFGESTAVSVSQTLIIYVRYLVEDKTTLRAEPLTSFLAIRSFTL